MFTQCPDCQTTFRVSAGVLQQAAGHVRCGGCGSAFNALEHLSADEPEQGNGSDAPTEDKNKELLETLEKLAGPEDVIIEDTGVEWRVVDQDEEDDAVDEGTGDSSSLSLVIDDEPPPQHELHGRHDDIPAPVSESQEALGFPGPEPVKADEIRYDDDTVLPDDFGDDPDLDEAEFVVPPDTPKRRASDREEAEDKSRFEQAQVDLALGDPDEWEDLLEEVEDEPDEQAAEEAASDDEDDSPTDVSEAVAQQESAPADTEEDMPSDIDSQFLQQAEDMGIDTGSYEIVSGQLAESEDEEEEDIGGDEIELSLADDDADLQLESTGEFEAQIDIAARALAGEDEEDEPEAEESEEPDDELELEEDTASPDEATAKEPTIIEGKDVSVLFDEDSQLVETIVLEGDMVNEALEERRAPVALEDLETDAPLEDTYALSRGKIRGGRRATDPPSYTVIASVIVLGLLLVGQMLHQSRQSLATYGAFNQTIGPIYRALGKPVTPEWDIRGWQFEATNGSVDDNEELLTIYSRIANKSSEPLPYPLVHVSLTDRWEEIIGSRVLEPNEYLAGKLDPSRLVSPGNMFTAVITIESPSENATGFKLNVCYRLTPDRVRCAIEDFKN